MSLIIKDVEKQYKIMATGTLINALNGVSITIPTGKTLGIVGESRSAIAIMTR